MIFVINLSSINDFILHNKCHLSLGIMPLPFLNWSEFPEGSLLRNITASTFYVTVTQLVNNNNFLIISDLVVMAWLSKAKPTALNSLKGLYLEI